MNDNEEKLKEDCKKFNFDVTKHLNKALNESLQNYKLRVYIDCLGMIKNLLVFVDKTFPYIPKEKLEHDIDAFIKMFEDVLRGSK